MPHNNKPVCPSCGGSGEICFFQGESRFLLTREECPACLGLGYLLEEPSPDKKGDGKARKKPTAQ